MPVAVINSSNSYKRWLEDFLLNNMPRRLSLQKERNLNLEDWTEEEVIKEYRISKFEVNYISNPIKDSM